jgi:hypothetical protein
LIYLKRLYLGIKEKLSQLHLLKFIESSPNSFDWISQPGSKTSKLGERIQTISQHNLHHMPTFIGVGINFGEYFPSNCKSCLENDRSCNSVEKFE